MLGLRTQAAEPATRSPPGLRRLLPGTWDAAATAASPDLGHRGEAPAGVHGSGGQSSGLEPRLPPDGRALRGGGAPGGARGLRGADSGAAAKGPPHDTCTDVDLTNALRVQVQYYDPPVSGNSTFEFDAIAQSCDSAVDAGACATSKTTRCSLARPKTRTRWRMAAVNVLSAL